ncbi:MAG: class I SAM-dependent methyltransferase [Erythrobacter sp.]|nr:class I SAM-dependent methyltransferase [Erythrobacter sp.]
MMIKPILMSSFLALACACSQSPTNNTSETAVESSTAPEATAPSSGAQVSVSLDDVLATLPDQAKARFQYRNPKETLEFFGVEPGMTVVDTTPGSIWYSGILAKYLGPNGKVIGADRPLSVWEFFGPEYSPPEFLAERVNWPNTWPEERAAEQDENSASFDAIAFGTVSDEYADTADIVLIMREFHNIMAADETDALALQVLGEIHMILKSDGVLGIVQHRAPESASDEWANGSYGYLKASRLITLVETAGFVLEAESDVNANPKDQPSEEDFVWRLPPDLTGSEEDPERREQMLAIGESNRMTLKFRKVSRRS